MNRMKMLEVVAVVVLKVGTMADLKKNILNIKPHILI